MPGSRHNLIEFTKESALSAVRLFCDPLLSVASIGQRHQFDSRSRARSAWRWAYLATVAIPVALALALFFSLPDATDLAYKGPGAVFETSLGQLVFSRDSTVFNEAWGFDLGWPTDKIGAAMLDQVELVEASGLISVKYKPWRSSLEISVSDDTGDVLHFTRRVGPQGGGKDKQAAFSKHLRAFFDYMRGDYSPDSTLADNCPGGRCSCESSRCSCAACCPTGFQAYCGCQQSCRCICLKLQDGESR